MEVLNDVLAYRLLNNVNLPEDKKQLVQATVIEVKYKIMKEQLKKVFISLSMEKRSREKALKLQQNDSFMLKILPRENTMKISFTINQLLKITRKTESAITKKKSRTFK